MPRETVNLDVEKFRDELISRKISISELEVQCYFTKGYINQVINKNGKLLNLKYNQIIKVLNLPYGALLLSAKHNVPNVSGAGRVLVDYEYIKSYLKLKGMTMKELSYNLNWSTGYLNKMNGKSGSTIPNIRYKQLTDFLDVPYETFLVNKSKPEPEPESKPKTFGELLSSGEIMPEDFKQQHPSITKQEPEQIELISMEHEMLLEVKKLTSTMQEILNVLKGWE